MNRETLLALGSMVFGALYLVGIFADASLRHAPVAAIFAVATAGVTYLSYFAQVGWPDDRPAHVLLVGASISGGIASGLILIAGY